MKNLIGVSLETLGAYKWPEFLDDKKSGHFQVFEINRQANLVPLSEHIDYEKMVTAKATFSMHSGASFYFAGNDIFNQTSRNILLSEIKLCEILRIKKLIFHIKDNYCPEIIEFIKSVANNAHKNNIELILENNHKGDFSQRENLGKIAQIADLKINIDLGHLKVATGANLEKAKKYITILSDRITYVHLHTNDGDKDSHLALNLNDKFIIEIIKMIKSLQTNDIWWVCENNSVNDALKSKIVFEKII